MELAGNLFILEHWLLAWFFIVIVHWLGAALYPDAFLCVDIVVVVVTLIRLAEITAVGIVWLLDSLGRVLNVKNGKREEEIAVLFWLVHVLNEARGCCYRRPLALLNLQPSDTRHVRTWHGGGGGGMMMWESSQMDGIVDCLTVL